MDTNVLIGLIQPGKLKHSAYNKIIILIINNINKNKLKSFTEEYSNYNCIYPKQLNVR